jgi:hypothetical protein
MKKKKCVYTIRPRSENVVVADFQHPELEPKIVVDDAGKVDFFGTMLANVGAIQYRFKMPGAE